MSGYEELIARLRGSPVLRSDVLAAADVLETELSVQHWSDCAVFNSPAYPAGECNCGGFSPKDARIAELEAENKTLRQALKLMIDTQDEWEKSVAKVIGKQPSVFNRAIDTARAALNGEKG